MSFFSPNIFLDDNKEFQSSDLKGFTKKSNTRYTGMDIVLAKNILQVFNSRGYRNKKEKEAAIELVKILQAEAKGRTFIKSDIEDILGVVYTKIKRLIATPTFLVLGITMLWLIGFIGLALLFGLLVGSVFSSAYDFVMNVKEKIKDSISFNESTLFERLLSEEIEYVETGYKKDLIRYIEGKLTEEEKQALLKNVRQSKLIVRGFKHSPSDLASAILAAFTFGAIITMGAVFIGAFFMLLAVTMAISIPVDVVRGIVSIRDPEEIEDELKVLEAEVRNAPVRYS